MLAPTPALTPNRPQRAPGKRISSELYALDVLADDGAASLPPPAGHAPQVSPIWTHGTSASVADLRCSGAAGGGGAGGGMGSGIAAAVAAVAGAAVSAACSGCSSVASSSGAPPPGQSTDGTARGLWAAWSHPQVRSGPTVLIRSLSLRLSLALAIRRCAAPRRLRASATALFASVATRC
jgi:hypothetical protein